MAPQNAIRARRGRWYRAEAGPGRGTPASHGVLGALAREEGALRAREPVHRDALEEAGHLEEGVELRPRVVTAHRRHAGGRERVEDAAERVPMPFHPPLQRVEGVVHAPDELVVDAGRRGRILRVVRRARRRVAAAAEGKLLDELVGSLEEYERVGTELPLGAQDGLRLLAVAREAIQ